MDRLMYDAFPAEVRGKIGFCFRERNGDYYAFPADGYKVASGSDYHHYIKSHSFKSLLDLCAQIVPALAA